MRVFYVLNIKDKALSECMEAIRFLSDPAEKHRAHITVRGPYRKRIDISSINRKIAGDKVVIDNVGNFFESGQNTVYFRCSSPELRAVWKKKNYPFNPHVTVYDSDSGDFARRLFGVISRYKYRLEFRADELEVMESRKGQASFSLALAFNSDLVRHVVGKEIKAEDVHTLSEDRRLDLIDRLCEHLAVSSTQDQALEKLLPVGAQLTRTPVQASVAIVIKSRPRQPTNASNPESCGETD
jgi:2'-5' RNA ligase